MTTGVTEESEDGAEIGKQVTLQIAWEGNYSQSLVNLEEKKPATITEHNIHPGEEDIERMESEGVLLY